MNTKHILATALILLPALSLGGPADSSTVSSAQATSPGIVVRFADLDLSTSAGRRTLHARLEAAADRICSEDLSRPSGVDNARCRQELVDAAVTDINTRLRLAGNDTRVMF